jgi:hypothetical protein
MDEEHFGGIPTRGVQEVLYDKLSNVREAMAGLQQGIDEHEKWMSISLSSDDTLELVGDFSTRLVSFRRLGLRERRGGMRGLWEWRKVARTMDPRRAGRKRAEYGR